MSQASLARFISLALGERGLQEQLWETATPGEFLRLARELGAQCGQHFSADEIEAALRAPRNAAELVEDVDLDGWFPARLAWHDTRPVVEWCYLGRRRFSEPFFEQSLAAGRQHPFNRLFRVRTPIDALATLNKQQPGLPVAGLIFHMSRCGSTLVAQLLASLPQAVVLAEAEPIDAVLRARFHEPALSDDQRCAWLRWVVGALGRQRDPREQQVFIKFDSWSVLDLPLIRRTFPGAPWVFVHRDPVEVMVSHARMRGSQMVPGHLEPALLGFDSAEIPPHALDEYCARVLGSICGAAARFAADGSGRLVSYRELPDAVWSSLLDRFGVTFSAADVNHMRHVGQFHAKSPAIPFTTDAPAKQVAATEELRRLAEHWVGPAYRRLVALGAAQQSH